MLLLAPPSIDTSSGVHGDDEDEEEEGEAEEESGAEEEEEDGGGVSCAMVRSRSLTQRRHRTEVRTFPSASAAE